MKTQIGQQVKGGQRNASLFVRQFPLLEYPRDTKYEVAKA
jgi:hypothetical protein